MIEAEWSTTVVMESRHYVKVQCTNCGPIRVERKGIPCAAHCSQGEG